MDKREHDSAEPRQTTDIEAHRFNERVIAVENRLKQWKYRAITTDDRVRPGMTFLRVDISAYLVNASGNDRPGQAEGTELVTYDRNDLTIEKVIQIHTHHYDKTGLNNKYRYFVRFD